MADHRTSILTVNPDRAMKWLEADRADHHNRPIHESVVQRYATSMLRGEWRLTPEPIIFGTDTKTILDGQHRLWAVVRAGEKNPTIEVEFTISVGWSADIQMVVDVGLTRSALDTFSLIGSDRHFPNGLTARHVAAARTLLIVSHDMVGAQVTRDQLYQFLAKYYDSIDFTIRQALRRAKIGVSQAPVAAVVVAAHANKESPEALIRFSEILMGSVMAEPSEIAAHLLRNWLMGSAGRRAGPSVIAVFNKTQRALRAFLDQEPLTVLYESRQQLFPIQREPFPVVRNKKRKAI